MTKKELERRNRPWLRTEALVVTLELKALLTQKPPAGYRVEYLAWMVHWIIQKSEDYRWFTNVHSDELKAKIGSDYARYRDWLIDHGIVELNPIYSTGTPTGGKAFSKSLRVCGLDYSPNSKPLVVFQRQLARFSPLEDNSELTDEVSRYVHRCLGELTVRETLVPISNEVRAAFALEASKRVFSGCFNVRYGTHSPRLFHSVIQMVKEARRNLMFRRGPAKLVYCDIQSCFPNLLPFWIHKDDEKRRWVELLKGDVYEHIRKVQTSQCSRDDIKRQFSKLLSDPDHRSNSATGEFLRVYFPDVFRRIESERSMALELQSKEAEIVVKGLCGWAATQGRWIVPMHDGFLCKDHDSKELCDRLKMVFREKVGHEPNVGIEVLE